MATLLAGEPGFGKALLFFRSRNTNSKDSGGRHYKQWAFLVALVFMCSLAVAQNAPTITGVDPASGKVNDTITVSGSNLGKATISSVYLSDDKSDFKATIIEQSDDKITMKVPQVKAGDYNISVQVGDKLFIKPVKFKVEQ